MADEARILIVDDDPVLADTLSDFCTHEGYSTAVAADGVEALNILDADTAVQTSGTASHGVEVGSHASGPFGLVITDVVMPGCSGMDLLREVRRKHPSLAVIMITGYGRIESAVEAVRLGAVDYLTKPLVDDELRIAVNKALHQHALLAENQTLRNQLSERYGLGNIIGNDYRMQKVYELIEAVAPSRTTVVINGESGTGKTMVARAVHTMSDRNSGPFATFSCGSIPETLLESELFGHVKGAFTGAVADKKGRILSAHEGTLFIDEINSATPALQLKLLRVLQDKQFEPVGSSETINVDVRFVLATNQPLKELVEAGTFREDLYYRINVVNILLPTLRERTGDIPMLAEHFLQKHAREVGKTVTGFDEAALEALRRYGWPGNVRELENAIERSVVLSRRPVIGVEDLPDTVHGATPAVPCPAEVDADAAAVIPALRNRWTPTPLVEALKEPERQILKAALEANQWNRQATARQLKINRTTLYKKIRQFGLDTP